MMSSLSGAGNNDELDAEICTARLNDAQQLSLMEEGNDLGVGANANVDATAGRIDISSPPLMPPMSDSQEIAIVTEVAAQHDQMEEELKGTSNVSLLPPLPDAMTAAVVNQRFDDVEGDIKMNLAGLRMTSNSGEVVPASLPPMSDTETIAAVLDIDAQCDQIEHSPMGPTQHNNTMAASIDKRTDRGTGTDSEGLDMTSENSGQVNLEGGEHVVDDKGPEIADTSVGQTTPRDQSQGQGPMRGSAATLPPSPSSPQAAGRVEDVSGGATNGPSAESLTRARNVLGLYPSIPILEAMLVEDEIPTARVTRHTSLYQATQIPDPLPVPWWKRHQKYLIGVSAATLAAFIVALGVVLSRGEPQVVLPPSYSNFTYYPDRMNRKCSNATSGRDSNSSGQIMFETAERCCEEMFWDYQDECFVNSIGTSHRPSSPPSDSPTISDVPSSPPSEGIRSHSPSESMSPTLSASPTYQPSLSTRPTAELQSSALRLVISDYVVGEAKTENVAIQGDIAVIGAPFNDNEKGAAFVMKRDADGWSQVTRLEAPDGEGGDRFGYSVAINGNTIIVGAYRDDSRKGSAHIFAKINDSWHHQVRLVAPDRDADNDDGSFGCSVGIHQNRVVIGAYLDDSIDNDEGSAYVFVQNDTTWTFESKLLAPDGDDGDWFGRSVGIFKYKIAVGAPREGAGAPGAAHIYSRASGGSWEHCAKLSSPDGASGDFFGWSMGIHGNHVIVGAPRDDSNGHRAGASFIFANEGSTWPLEAKLLAPGRAADYRFGRSVDIFEGTAAVSSPGYDDNGPWSGSVHLFELTRGAWSHRANLLAPDRAAGDYFGHSIAIHNGTVIAHSVGSGETFVFSG